MALHSPISYFSENIDSASERSVKEESSLEKSNQEGFSTSMILNLESDVDLKPYSKLINITQIVPGTKKSKKLLLPIFYRKNPPTKHEKTLFFIEESSPIKCPSTSFLQDLTKTVPIVQSKINKPRPTASTIGSMHTLSNLDSNHDFFKEKVIYNYESDLRSSMHEGNLIAYCHNCKKETVTIMQQANPEKSLKDIILCCCTSWNSKSQIYKCPICAEILLKTN